MRVVFCESPQLVRQHASGLRAGLVVAATPAAALAALELDLSFRRLEDFYDEAALVGERWPQMRRQAQWVDAVDALLVDALPSWLGFRPASALLGSLKVLSDGLFMRTRMLQGLLAGIRPSEVVHLAEPPGPIQLWDSGSPFPALWPAVAGAHSLRYSVIHARPLRRWPPRAAAAIWSRARARRRASDSRGAPETMDIILVGANSELDELSRELRPSHVLGSLETWLGRSPQRVVVDAPPAGLLDDGLFASLWRSDGVDYYEAALPYLRHHFLEVAPRLAGFYVSARNRLESSPPKAFLSSDLFTAEPRALQQAAAHAGVPWITYQHGGHIGYCDHPLWSYCDGRADLHLVYGDGVAAYYRDHPDAAITVTAEIAAVGSAALDAARPAARTGARSDGAGSYRRVLYCANLIAGDNAYLDGSWYPDVPHFETELALFELFARRPRLELTWRPFPGSASPVLDRVVRLRHAVVDPSTELATLAARNDLTILGYSGTAMLHALLSGRPLIVYVPVATVTMADDAKRLLRRRAHLAESQAELLELVSRVLDADPAVPTPDPTNTDFLKHYGTHLNDGRSAARAAAAVEGLIRGADGTAARSAA